MRRTPQPQQSNGAAEFVTGVLIIILLGLAPFLGG